ncbi:O-antigen ligase family protein [Thermogemmatispora sp.]|uniref:O-antigen ligase family protein n=1 Tax=Thermogemmatispora sp. TaxID=1968838 RepID=UPI0035E44C73
MSIVEKTILRGLSGERERRERLTPSAGLLALLIGALILVGMLEVFAPLLVGTVIPSTSVTRQAASMATAMIAGLLFLVLLLYLRCDEILAVTVALVHLYLDFYMSLIATAQLLTLVLLVVFFLGRSPQRPWAEPRPLWLWLLFLGLTIFPALRGATNLDDALFYYPNIIVGSFLFFWLGLNTARNLQSLWLSLELLAAFGALIAAHTIVIEVTGKFILGTSLHDPFLKSVSNFTLGETGVQRIGGFFVDPNWNGTFFAFVLFIPLGLYAHTRSWVARLVYLSEALLIGPALLFTFSGGAWVAACCGLILFLLLVDSWRLRLQIALSIFLVSLILLVFFSDQLQLLFGHLTGQGELSLRLGAWETGLNVIMAYPLTGVGFGLSIYMQDSGPYRSPLQYVPLAHPHDSYLEFGAMGGLPVLVVFLALLACYLWKGWRNWQLCDSRHRALLAGGLAAVGALCINSISINGWTLPPLACFGWLMLGLISSPLLHASLVATPATADAHTHD